MKNLFLLALLTSTLFSAQPNPLPGVGLQSAEYFQAYDQQVQSSAQKPDLILHNDPTFFTGKHFDQDLGSYVFKYRNYSPDSNRWTSADPSGFPDGPNNYAYAPVPTIGIDPTGLKKFGSSENFGSAPYNWSFTPGVIQTRSTGDGDHLCYSGYMDSVSCTGSSNTVVNYQAGTTVGGGLFDSTSYSQTLDHEMAHVNIFNAWFEKYVSQTTSQMISFTTNKYSNPEAAINEVQSVFNQVYQQIRGSEFTVLNAAQGSSSGHSSQNLGVNSDGAWRRLDSDLTWPSAGILFVSLQSPITFPRPLPGDINCE